MDVKAGAIVRFVYTGASTSGVDRNKEVLVLHPNWRGKLHGIDIRRLTPAEQIVIRTIFDPKYVSGKQRHRFPLVNDILQRMNPLEEVVNPLAFYAKFVRVFIRNKDVYRTYYPHLIHSVHVVKESGAVGGVYNPKPLFKKI